MWQSETFNPTLIDTELGYAETLGFTAVRVFLHNLAFDEDNDGFLGRIKEYLKIAISHNIQTMFVLLDSCWQPDPQIGPQPPPTPYVHNSQWLQSPGEDVVTDEASFNLMMKP